MDIIRHIWDFFLRNKIDTSENQFLLTCSGGADSMALLYAFQEMKLNFSVAHCNFMLRGEDSHADEKLVVDTCNRLSIKCFVKQFPELSKVKKSGKSIQEVARNLRYNYFYQLCEDHHFNYLVTAHHANDQIENFIMYASRGTGIKGLIGMQEINDKKIRPLLNVFKEDIYQFIREKEIQFKEDLSNFQNNYSRNKVRNEILPLFSSLFNNYQYNLKKTIDHLQSFHNANQYFLNKFLEANIKVVNNNHYLKINEIKEIPFEVFFSLLQKYDLNEVQSESLYQLIQSGKTGTKVVFGDYTFYVQRVYFIIAKQTQSAISELCINQFENEFQIENLKGEIIQVKGNEDQKSNIVVYCDYEKLVFPLVWRIWKRGDKIKPKGLKGTKKISDILIDNKIELFEKERTYVLVNGDGEIIWLSGIRFSESFIPLKNLNKVLKLSFLGNI